MTKQDDYNNELESSQNLNNQDHNNDDDVFDDDDYDIEEIEIDCSAPILELDLDNICAYPNGDKLPGIWITIPVEDEDGKPIGRTYLFPYPASGKEFKLGWEDEEEDGSDDEEYDANGENALYFGGRYYDEGMSHSDPSEFQDRIDCFRAAEILYRHASARGNKIADLCLGYVYSYDRCKGNYWVDLDTVNGAPGDFPRKERAFECLKRAAEADIPEACYKLGDQYKHGNGCDPDAGEAFRWYVRASELSDKQPPVILGSIALRLAGCYEDGFGCEQNFSRALKWYRRAVAGLEIAVNNGDWYYEKALAGARAGEKRCEQEVG